MPIPHVFTKAQAEQIVEAARFAPIGKHGFYGGRRSYGEPDYFEKANDEPKWPSHSVLA